VGSFGGQPCYLVSGTGTVMVNELLFNQTGYAPGLFIFSTCLSASYDVPYYVNVVIIIKKNGNIGNYVHFNMTNSGMVLQGVEK
jgi:hypothetical protein